MANDKESRERFLKAVRQMTSGKKPVIQRFQGKQPQPQKQPQEEPPTDKFAQLVAKAREQQQQQSQQEDLIRQNMMYSQAVGAHPSRGTIPASMLGYTQPHPEKGAPIGVDLSVLKDEERQNIWNKLSLEDQEKLVSQWGGNQ